MKIVFLMAGEGRRFMGNDLLPKPLIKLAGTELIKWAVNSYNFIGYCIKWSDIYFVIRLDHIRNFSMDKTLKAFFSKDINIRYVEKTTRGPAETALVVEQDIAPDEQVIVSDCDMFFSALPLFEAIVKIKDDTSVWGILPYVKRQDNQNSWSYLELDKNSRVIKVNEKDVEMFNAGCPGIVGAYTFNHWKYFTQEARKMIAEGDLAGEENKKEYYMSKVFARFVNSGKKVLGVNTYPSWILGTPAQFESFEGLLTSRGRK
jgi:NDP-sugar pyrophosphorylase family protein